MDATRLVEFVRRWEAEPEGRAPAFINPVFVVQGGQLTSADLGVPCSWLSIRGGEYSGGNSQVVVEGDFATVLAKLRGV